ncbi:RagB/SusD family nutrient uptake outer membrane protein [uncultured Alistipes sp.]|jgi:ragB/susD domain protein|uniref:RagB/SusD family nutrient uptake outer membrane protein n=1 Tax=uncultured Alistipes sp. TaxID=538949 RepID=UPI0025D832DD|nr:RagB/SusD family nutrient uptake outer membrane protein [uncultured Alistipes sp.]
MKTGKQILTKALGRLVVLLAAVGATSCLNDYLDKAPDSGLTEKEVFSKYANFKSYFYAVYDASEFNIKAHYPLWFGGNNQKFTLEGLTDICDMSRLQRCQPGKLGDGSQVTWAVGYNSDAASKTAKVPYSWKAIRVCNRTIDNIDMLQDATDREKEDLLAQAYFVRAYAHFELFRLYGSMPYIDKVLGANDEWDLPRLDDNDFCQRVAEDFKTAAEHFDKAGLMRRDPASGSGHLAAPDQDKPNGVTALAMRGRALLYAASPLSNPTDATARWEEAALANWEALQAARTYGYELLPQAKYTDNFYGTKYTNEQLWGYSTGSTTNYNNERVQAYVGYCFSNNTFSSAHCPTQNFVDRFETAGGYPLNSEAERAVAASAGQYNEQDPFANRDPRFGMVVIYNQKPLQGYGNASLFVNEDGSLPSGSLLYRGGGGNAGVSETYYYEHKRTGMLSNKGIQNLILTDPIIRLAEVYLNYAEAANEAWGPQGMAPGADMTALQALNAVRGRVNMPEVLAAYTTDAQALRPRIKNERTVELCFEGYHYYCDVRRWKDAPQLGRIRLTGMRATKLTAGASAQYPTGYRYERFELPSNRQIGWKNDGMYYVQFQESDLLKMKNYVPNQAW